MGVERQRTGLELGSGSEPALELLWWKRGIRETLWVIVIRFSFVSSSFQADKKSIIVQLCSIFYNRLQTMVRSLQWASGRLVELDAVDEMIAVVEQFLQEVQNIGDVQRSAS